MTRHFISDCLYNSTSACQFDGFLFFSELAAKDSETLTLSTTSLSKANNVFPMPFKVCTLITCTNQMTVGKNSFLINQHNSPHLSILLIMLCGVQTPNTKNPNTPHSCNAVSPYDHQVTHLQLWLLDGTCSCLQLPCSVHHEITCYRYSYLMINP